MRILNKAQVDALFQQEAVLINSEDVVPFFRTAMQFGESAVEFAIRHTGEQGHSGYGVGGYTLLYFNRRGFQVAASFYNMQQLRKEQKEWESAGTAGALQGDGD